LLPSIFISIASYRDEIIAYHNYSQQTPRPRHWADQANRVTELIQRSHRRLRHILGIRVSEDDSDDFAEIEHYGLGSKQTIVEYVFLSEFQRAVI
jgi:hypothetical protein